MLENKIRRKVKLSAKQRWEVENIIIPIILFVVSFYDFNNGIDLTDAGFSLSNFFYFETIPGVSVIPTFWSNVVGFLFTRLPEGNTWRGCLFYCTFVIALSVAAAYFFVKKYIDFRIVLVAEVFAIFYCWNPNSVLYDYLSFLLFEIAVMFLLKGIEKEKKIFYVTAGIIIGINTFVRLPNAAEIAAIVLVWYAGWYKKQSLSMVLRKTGDCVLGYFGGLAISFGAIFLKYDWADFMEAINELILESVLNEDYGIAFMLFQTLKVVGRYKWYVVYFLCIIAVGTVLHTVFNKVFALRKNTVRTVMGVTLTAGAVFSYVIFSKKYGLYSSEWTDFSSVLGVSCIFLLWGILVCILNLFLSTDLETRLLALVFLGTFYVTPLGSNNHIYLVIMNMFMLIPLVVYHSLKLESEVIGILKNVDSDALKWSYRAVMYGSLIIMMWQVMHFGLNYVFHDENVSITIEDANILHGMKTGQEKAEKLNELILFCEEQNLTGRETIFYCNGPGLAFMLQLKPALSSTWMDWYTNTTIQFEKEIYSLNKAEKTPIVILSSDYSAYLEQDWEKLDNMEIDVYALEIEEKWQVLLKFMRKNDYDKIYEQYGYVIYQAK